MLPLITDRYQLAAKLRFEAQVPSQENATSSQGMFIPCCHMNFDDLMQREGISSTSPVDDETRQPPKMIGDYDDGANALWTLYGKEAKSYDNFRINTLKDDMDGVLIFVSSYSYFHHCCVHNLLSTIP
jgi:hypothetical protein